jgi:hypothetical protein
MTTHTEQYCTTLNSLDRVAAIRAIHQAHLQLSALSANCEVGHYDNAPALLALEACLVQAGHWGFIP